MFLENLYLFFRFFISVGNPEERLFITLSISRSTLRMISECSPRRVRPSRISDLCGWNSSLTGDDIIKRSFSRLLRNGNWMWKSIVVYVCENLERYHQIFRRYAQHSEHMQGSSLELFALFSGMFGTQWMHHAWRWISPICEPALGRVSLAQRGP